MNTTKEEENTDNGVAIQLSVVLGPESGLITFSPDMMHMDLAEDISYEQYLQVLSVLKSAKEKATIWMADAIRIGTVRFGADRVRAALEQLEFDMPVVRAAMAIESVPTDLRLPHLTTEHLIELSKTKDIAYRLKWARIASEQQLNATQLKFSLIENEIVDRHAARQLQTGVITIQGIRQSFDIWARRVGGVEGVLKMGEDHIQEILGELQAIIDFGVHLHGNLTAVEADLGG